MGWVQIPLSKEILEFFGEYQKIPSVPRLLKVIPKYFLRIEEHEDIRAHRLVSTPPP